MTPAAAIAATTSRGAAARRRRVAVAVGTYAALTVLGVLFCFPFFWTISSSLKTGPETHFVLHSTGDTGSGSGSSTTRPRESPCQ